MRIHKGQNEKRCRIEDWGLAINANGELAVGGCSAVSLAKTFGTPLHVVHEDRLNSTARDFLRTFQDVYPGRVSAHFAFKCNGVPAVVETVMRAGFKAEVMSEFELDLALCAGCRGKDIVVNGPCKPDDFLKKCLLHGVRLIVVDSLDELDRLSGLARSMRKTAGILLRINPDYIPKGMNRGTAKWTRAWKNSRACPAFNSSDTISTSARAYGIPTTTDAPC
jgi:diaminopimelate decarboxylase